MSIFKKHHQMERFSAMFLAVIFMLIVSASGLAAYSLRSDRDALSNDAMYSKEIGFSRSCNEGEVKHVFTNKAGTKAFIVLSFKDMSGLPTEADDYAVTVYGASAKKALVGEPSSRMSGGFYVFGSSGNMGLYLSCPGGFASEVLYFRLLNKNYLGVVDDKEPDKTFDDNVKSEFFLKNNACGFFCNPGGKMADRLECLEGDGQPELSDLYYQGVLYDEEVTRRSSVCNQLKLLSADMRRIQDVEKRLVDKNGIAVPEKPSIISGDKMTVSEDGALIYEPNLVVEGGCDFDWVDLSAYDGYSKRLYLGDESLSEYLSDLHSLSSKYSNGSSDGSVRVDDFDATMGNLSWTFLDGRSFEFDMYNKARTSIDDEVLSNCTALVDAWRQYYVHKVEYETKGLPGLLDCELLLNSVNDFADVNMSEDFLSLYHRE